MDYPKKVQVQIINAFVADATGGNPAGVVLNADHLSDEEKLQIAAKVGLSETAFVSKSSVADFKLDFFTPNRQIAHCGHATIATFSYLRQLGKIEGETTSKETIDGTRLIRMVGNSAYMEQLQPTYRQVEDREDVVLKSMGIRMSDLNHRASMLSVNTGNSFMLVPVKDKAILKGIKPDLKLIQEVSDALDLIGYYVFTVASDNDEIDAYARMFGPRYGIAEEAATGMAAGPLAAYLYDCLNIKKTKFLIGQGQYMPAPSPSLLHAELLLKNGEISGMMVGGIGSLSTQLEFELQHR